MPGVSGSVFLPPLPFLIDPYVNSRSTDPYVHSRSTERTLFCSSTSPCCAASSTSCRLRGVLICSAPYL